MNAADADRSALRDWLVAAVMLLGVVATYRSPLWLQGEWRIGGADYYQLHARRIDFALEQLRDRGTIAAWYPREFMGSPFWSNVQNFPFIPVRLVVLWAGPEGVFTLGVWLSAALGATFAFLWLRRIGVGAVGSAVGGWTFAAGGFFASRVTAGHLPLLEAYAALPLLLWCVEGLRQATGRALARRVSALAVAAACASLAGHPQVPMYALAAAAIYAIVRLDVRRLLLFVGGAILGFGLAAFAAVPMTLLVLRSSRMLDLDPAANDIPLPYWRLKSVLLPWIDGAPAPLDVPGVGPFAHPVQYFWDTVTYVGWIPVLAIPLLIAWMMASGGQRHRWRMERAPLAAVIAIGAVGLVLALPWTRDLAGAGGVTILRSPARLTYLFTFAAASAGAAAIDLLIRLGTALTPRRRASLIAIAAAAVGWHIVDLHGHTRPFIHAWKGLTDLPPETAATMGQVGQGRVGIDATLALRVNRRIDDAGFFDSIMLANMYSGLLDLGGGSPRANVQRMDAAKMPTRVLRTMGVRMVLTTTRRTLPVLADLQGAWLYAVPDPGDRAAWFELGRAEFLDAPATRALLRDQQVDLVDRLVLPPEAGASLASPSTTKAVAGAVAYRRPDSDRIEITVDAPVAGFVRVLEACDRGWRATVNDADAPIWPAHGMAMAVGVPAGRSVVRMEFFTPGRDPGLSITAAAVVLLALANVWIVRSSIFDQPAVGEKPADQGTDPIA